MPINANKKFIPDLLHKGLSYEIHGAAIEVRKDFGPGHKEKLYQNAFAEELKRREILFEKEKAIKIYSPKDGKYIGLYRPDFIVDQKVIVEIKAEKFVSRDEIKRIYDYLRNSQYELAYFINFASPKLFVKRIIYSNDRKPFHKPPMDTNIKLINAKNLLVSIGFILVFFSGLQTASAAQLNFISPVQEIKINQRLKADLVLNAEGESINAVEGKIILPDFVKIKDLQDGNTIVSLWIQKPKLANHNQIVFSGIIPGGYNGSLGKIFSILFQAEKEGQGIIQITDGKALLNDGQGTEAKLTTQSLSLAVISDTISVPSRVTALPDTELPESFVPEIAKDETLFDGKWFVVFATQDKASGIDHYEIKESRQTIFSMFKKWTSAESPHVLQDQELRSFVFVKAVDRTGHERIIKIAPRNPLAWYENYENWVMIIVGLLIIAPAARKLWKKQLT